ncbi:MAG: spore germination protein [Clostridia bacterium]|nr:spore germination protein [Clostridia bacterium]
MAPRERPPFRAALPADGQARAVASAASIDRVRRYISSELEANVRYIEELLGVRESYDILSESYDFRGVRVHVFVINGFFEARTVLQVLRTLAELGGGRPGAEAVRRIVHERVTLPACSVVRTIDDFVTNVLSGPTGLLIDGCDAGVVVDTRIYPARMPNTPETEKVILGPHDGFVETLLYNTTLIRRRLRDPRMRCEIIHLGRHSRTDVALCYLAGVVDAELLARVRARLADADVRNVTSAERAVANLLSRHPWNPLPTVRFTERADLAAANVVEGRVVVIVDTSPNAIVVPAPLFTHVPHAEDFHVGPLAATYMRWVSLLAGFFAVFLPPLWLLGALEPRYLPPALHFVGPRQPPTGLSLTGQFVLAEVAIELIRRAVLNTPTSITSAMTIVGAIIVGDAVTRVGLFTPEVLVVMGFATILNFAISSVEMGIVARLFRLALLVLVGLLRLPGLVLGALLLLALAVSTDSLGVPYLWPLLPFDWRAFKAVFVVSPVTADMAPRGQSPATGPRLGQGSGG